MGHFEHPIALTAGAFIAACLVTFAVETLSMSRASRAEHWRPAPASARAIDVAARIPIVALIFAIFFAISWRPLYSAGATISFFAIFTGISRAKFQFIREPLIFSDIALVVDVFKHKEIFYATRLNILFWIVPLLYVFGASALFMVFEPTVLPDDHRTVLVLAMILLTAAPVLLLFNALYRSQLARIATWLFGRDDIRTITIRLGTFAAVSYHFLMWLGRQRASFAAGLTERFNRAVDELVVDDFADHQALGGGPPLVVVWQSESFVDMRHYGVAPLALPHLDRLRRRALEWGRLASVFEGGYTLRTEFSVLTGLSPAEIGADSAYPYLRAADYAGVSWPGRFRRAGWSTHFIHPYDRRFFVRDRAMPQLGFEAMTMLDAFAHDQKLDGRYVSDMTLSKRVLALCAANDQAKGQFIFAASMENHGPWHPGRCEDRSDPLDIYLGILERSDAALGHLADALDAMDRPVWLVFYGDHAPLLKSFADPFPDSRTDYFVVPLGRAATTAPQSRPETEKTPWNLLDKLVGHLHLRDGDGDNLPIAPFSDGSAA